MTGLFWSSTQLTPLMLKPCAPSSGGQAAPFLVLAERQTAGRGRRGRKWVSPFAENIYYSLVLRIEGGMRQLEGLSLVVGLAVMQALRELGIPGAGLKWPNDVLVGQKKIAGILLELVGDPADVCHVVLGVGINVNMQMTDEVDQQWTSMRLESGRAFDRNHLVAQSGGDAPGLFELAIRSADFPLSRRSGSKIICGRGALCR